MEQNAQPVFGIEKLYVKDLSVEVPNAPEIFLEQEAPFEKGRMEAAQIGYTYLSTLVV